MAEKTKDASLTADSDKEKKEPAAKNQEDKKEEGALAKPKSGGELDAKVIQEVYTGTAEKTVQESSWVRDTLIKPYNPDPLVQKSWDYAIYEEMLEDDQVSVALQVKKDLVIGSGWTIHADESQTEIKEFLENTLRDDTDRPFGEILEEIIQAYEFGFSLSEKLFAKRPDGMLRLKDIKTRHPGTWVIHTDKHGNVTEFEQRGRNESIKVNPDSLIHYVNNPKHQNPYGRSDLFPAYQAYMTKRHITRFYAIFLEKAASPIPVAKYARGVPQEAVDDVYQAIKKFQTKTAMAIPKDIELEFLEATNNGEVYVKGINLFNMFIGRAMFIPDLVGFQGSETGGGSYALGKDQIGLFFRHIYKRRAVLERIVNLHIIRALTLYNFGAQEKFPQFCFNALSDEDGRAQADLWIKAMQGKHWKPTIEEVNHFRDLIKFPKTDFLEEVAPPVQLGPDGQPINPNDPNMEMDPENVPHGTEDGDAHGKEKGEMAEHKNPKMGKGPIEGSGKKPASHKESEEKAKEEKDYAYKQTPGDYAKKVDFKAADTLLKNVVKRVMSESEPIIDDIFEDLYDQIQKKKIIQSQNLEKAESLDLKYLKKLQLILKKQFRRLYQDAQTEAAREVKKGDFATNIPADEFLDFLEQETFKYIGDWEYTVLSKTKQELVAAIKDGLPLSSVIAVMDSEGRKLSEESLERYSRTKSTEVFNRGRMEYFEATGVVSAYQYSAILDSVTSELCAGLHGTIFEKEDAPVPPLHFNCRSVLIPITRYESYEPSKKANDGTSIDKFIDENKGKGFPRN